MRSGLPHFTKVPGRFSAQQGFFRAGGRPVAGAGGEGGRWVRPRTSVGWAWI